MNQNSGEPGISLRRWKFDDPAWHIQLTASNGAFQAQQEFYAWPEELGKFGNQLTSFPRELNPDTEVRFEHGSREGNWAYFILLRAFIANSVGAAAIEVNICNRGTVLHHAEANFFISCEVASINHFGNEICAWIANSDCVLAWKPT